jgi:hypothetical protein
MTPLSDKNPADYGGKDRGRQRGRMIRQRGARSLDSLYPIHTSADAFRDKQNVFEPSFAVDDRMSIDVPVLDFVFKIHSHSQEGLNGQTSTGRTYTGGSKKFHSPFLYKRASAGTLSTHLHSSHVIGPSREIVPQIYF